MNRIPTGYQKADTPRTDYHIAVSTAEKPGPLLISGGGTDPQPDFPAEFALEKTYTVGLDPFTLEDAETGAQFRASVAPLEVSGVLLSQMVALPTAPVNQTIGTFLGIYSILSVIAIISGALVTRWLVTLTFRSLGQVGDDGDGDRRRRLQPAHDRHRTADDRGRPTQDGDQHDARAPRLRALAARRVGAADASVHRRRQPCSCALPW